MYDDTSVLDVHSHIRWQRGAASFMNMLLASYTALPSPLAGGKSSDLPGLRDEEFREAAARHASYLDQRQIDVQILGPHPVEVNGWMEPHIFKSWISYTNDAIFKMVQARPERWVGACQLPQDPRAPDTRHLLTELERCVTEYAFVATYVTPDVTGRRDTPGMNDAYWFPLYDKCQELDVPIIVHGTDGLDPRFRAVPHNYQLAFLSEQYFSLMFLRHSDVFERFPELRILICHCGGALDRFIKQSESLAPKKDLHNLFFDSCAYDLPYLAAAIKQRGVSQVCFGVEAPGSGFTIRPETGKSSDDLVPLFASHPELSFLSEQDRLDIFHHNPEKFCPGLASPVETNARARASAYRTPVAA
jgi:predicted TIM-barrel fold metal-dependent hydrolase